MQKRLRTAAHQAPPVALDKPEPTPITRTDEYLRLILRELRELNQKIRAEVA